MPEKVKPEMNKKYFVLIILWQASQSARDIV